MTLDQYLLSDDTRARTLAQAVGVSEATVSRVRKGAQNITIDLALAITAATNGAVTLDDLGSTRPNPTEHAA